MKHPLFTALRIAALIAVLVFAVGFAAAPASAAVEIPYGATITSATLKVYSMRLIDSPGAVNVHVVGEPWDETTVTWNSFGFNYGPAIASFDTLFGTAPNYREVDVTAAVQAWYAGAPNYGFLLEQGLVEGEFAQFFASEHPQALGPSLYVCYTVGGGAETCVTISGTVDVADVEIRNGVYADTNLDYTMELWTGVFYGITKMSLIRFDFFTQPPQGPGAGTPGYWKNHPEAWPVDSITIGGVTYTKQQALMYMEEIPGDKTSTLFRALVAAKLNVLIGNPSGCIDSTIADADAWMAMYGPVGSGVLAKSEAWEMGEPLYEMLDAYNNGYLCAMPRD